MGAVPCGVSGGYHLGLGPPRVRQLANGGVHSYKNAYPLQARKRREGEKRSGTNSSFTAD